MKKSLLIASLLALALAACGKKEEAAAPAPANAPRTATLNGRTIVVKNGKWVYQDTGEEAK